MQILTERKSPTFHLGIGVKKRKWCSKSTGQTKLKNIVSNHPAICITIYSTLTQGFITCFLSASYIGYCWVSVYLVEEQALLSSVVLVIFELSPRSQKVRLHSLCSQHRRTNPGGQTEHQATLQAYLKSPHQFHTQNRSNAHKKHCKSSS